MPVSRFTKLARAFVASQIALFAFALPLSVAQAQAAPTLGSAAAQQPSAMSEADLKAFAALHVAISAVHDTADLELALPRNKTKQAQEQLRDKQRTAIAALIKKAGLSDAEYEHRRYIVSSNGETRKQFDVLVATLSGTPTPGQVPVVAPATAAVPVPPGPAGIHIGHVVNAFGDTPNGMGLLPTAIAEVRIASQHATLALRAPTDLAAMKLHAGHVINALDPTIVAAGPGLKYGLKKSATAVAMHIELAAKADTASPLIRMHAPHIAAAARSTVARADQIILLAQQVQAATEPSAAASLLGQIVSLCQQLTTGADTNSDGRVSYDAPEGGLQQVQEHINLMLGIKN